MPHLLGGNELRSNDELCSRFLDDEMRASICIAVDRLSETVDPPHVTDVELRNFMRPCMKT